MCNENCYNSPETNNIITSHVNKKENWLRLIKIDGEVVK